MALRTVDLARIQALELFAGAAEATFADLVAGAYLQKFPAHTLLIQEGDATDFLHVLMDGSVELVGTWNDKETSLGLMEPVAVFVLAAAALDAVARGEEHLGGVRAGQEVGDAQQVEEILRAHPAAPRDDFVAQHGDVGGRSAERRQAEPDG